MWFMVQQSFVSECVVLRRSIRRLCTRRAYDLLQKTRVLLHAAVRLTWSKAASGLVTLVVMLKCRIDIRCGECAEHTLRLSARSCYTDTNSPSKPKVYERHASAIQSAAALGSYGCRLRAAVSARILLAVSDLLASESDSLPKTHSQHRSRSCSVRSCRARSLLSR